MYRANSDYVEILPKLELKRLNVIECLKKMQTLETLIVNGNYNNISFVTDILKSTSSLTQLFIGLKVTTLNLDEYNSVLALAKNRVKVSIHLYERTIDVDRDIIAKNREWLDI